MQNNILQAETKKHFDKIAGQYDIYKEKNDYYYSQLKKLYKNLIPGYDRKAIVELGCGCAGILDYLDPKVGVGIDISDKMIDNAVRKYKHKSNLHFFVGSIDSPDFMQALFNKFNFDYCILPDTIEHLGDIDRAFGVISLTANKDTKIIISWANPIWSPLLEALEFLKLKMPEGPHYWPRIQEVICLLQENSFTILNVGYAVLMPFNIPIVSNFVNNQISRCALLRKLCLIQYVICKVS